eukprot:TRINITY_DN14001_c0_g1_i8.p1 TRINITY_DN14001_c0_g1~~TRINITY_DN14001_c0_g1_i8.p1  ORF type:complete len:195 (+),score=31.14 TRINITY_DN14001_c0_g1_i8:177-761(+)
MRENWLWESLDVPFGPFGYSSNVQFDCSNYQITDSDSYNSAKSLHVDFGSIINLENSLKVREQYSEAPRLIHSSAWSNEPNLPIESNLNTTNDLSNHPIERKMNFILGTIRKRNTVSKEGVKSERHMKTIRENEVLAEELMGEFKVTRDKISEVAKKLGLKRIQVYKWYWDLSLIHICRCRRYAVCRSRWSPYH